MNIKTMAITAFIAATMLILAIACTKTADKKVADAETNVAQAQQNANNAAVQNDWQVFKAEAEAKIALHEKTIADYKTRMTNPNGKVSNKYDKRIVEVEKRNTAIKDKLQAYKEDGTTDWQQFKKEINTELDGVTTALKVYEVKTTK